MRIKNFTLLFLMGIFGLFTTNLFAQEDATISPDQIKYWVGEGVNHVIFIANWNEPDTALAWGYCFNEETLMVKDVMDAITEADYRIDYVASGSWLSNITFNDGVLDLSLAGAYWMYNINGITAGNYFDAQPVVNGDVIKFGDESCGIITDPELYTYIWTTPVAPVYALADEATIDPSEILYWVGEGTNEVVFAVNWAEPYVCYAWGYRFSTENVLVKDVMDAIAAADARFDYQGGGGMVYNITLDYDYNQLALVGDYWMYNINGGMAGFGYDQQPVVNGDFIKFGDELCGTEIAPWTLVWEAPVEPIYPYAVDATIDPSAILYWVGEGESEVIFAVNWAEPNVCYAWGYRFTPGTCVVYVKDVMDVIAAADTRFDYRGEGGMVYSINFDYGTQHLALVGDYWMYNINGVGAWYGYDEQTVENGDFIKFGDESCGTEIAPWSLVWETPVTPVSNNTNVNESENSFSLYPNPASSYTMLNIEGVEEEAVVTVTDIQGRVLNSFVVTRNSEPVRIETAGYQAGMYFVTVSDGVNRQTVKLSVK
jgi:hypothetical protein